ncbi:MAG: KH domain-containing protein, partial [Bdellovibrionales bacterium]|nr:KH domain-containing protein [Bdellovibrionales bacterium]
TEQLRDLVSELVREQCFLFLQQEIPYGLAVEVRKFEEKPGLTRIFADVIVEKDNHRMVVLGKGGQMIRQIGSGARAGIEKLVDTKVYLELHVAVKKKWYKNQQQMEALGYVVN